MTFGWAISEEISIQGNMSPSIPILKNFGNSGNFIICYNQNNSIIIIVCTLQLGPNRKSRHPICNQLHVEGNGPIKVVLRWTFIRMWCILYRYA